MKDTELIPKEIPTNYAPGDHFRIRKEKANKILFPGSGVSLSVGQAYFAFMVVMNYPLAALPARTGRKPKGRGDSEGGSCTAGE